MRPVLFLTVFVVLLAAATSNARAHTIPRTACYKAAKYSGHPYQSPKWQAVLHRCLAYRKRHAWNHKCGGTVRTIRCVFGRYGAAAVRVARCESGLRTTALGPRDEYGNRRIGLFQLGTYERSVAGKYTRWSSALVQSRSAFNYFAMTGYDFGAWECKP